VVYLVKIDAENRSYGEYPALWCNDDCWSITWKILQIRAAKDIDYLTCAGLETIIAEIKRGGKDDSKVIEAALKEICNDLISKMDEMSVKISVGPIIHWKSFEDGLRKTTNDIWRKLEKAYPQLTFLPSIAHLRLSEDGVHLQEKSATKYLEHVMSESLAVWLREDADMDQDDGGTSDSLDGDRTMVEVSTPTRQSFRLGNELRGLSQLRGEFRAFKRTMENRLE